MTKAVFICPGRGTYNKSELGVLAKHFPDRDVLARFDEIRSAAGQDTLTELDGAKTYSLKTHTRGDSASALIFATSYGDFLSLDRDIDIVAVTGNSMGWYTTLACAGALQPEHGFEVANTMGTLMQQSLVGGQLIYPHFGDDWRVDTAEKARLIALIDEINATKDMALSVSIYLGGMLVLAGNEAGLSAFEKNVAPKDRFPMRLPNHAAFHSSLMTPVSNQGKAALSAQHFKQPLIPMIDGRGAIWWPHATDTEALWDYTLGHQVTETYDFTKAISVAAKEFAPDLFIVAGPGDTLGGAVVQSFIQSGWKQLTSKSDFQSHQSQSPFLISMGRAEQRAGVT